MKASRTSSSLFAALSALALLGSVALTGCSSSSLTGPETQPEAVEATTSDAMGPKKGETGENNGTGTEHTASHNTLPEDD